jgi:hypothetical protein
MRLHTDSLISVGGVMTDKERAVIEAARKVAKWWPTGCLQYRKDCEELDEALAALDAPEADICPTCEHGEVEWYGHDPERVICPDCKGTGRQDR